MIIRSCELSVNLVKNLNDSRLTCNHVITLGIFGIMLFMKVNFNI